MTSATVEKLSHVCSSTHTSSDGLQVWVNEAGVYSGFCFACSTRVANPYGKSEGPDPDTIKIKTVEEIKADLDVLRNCKHPTFKHRGITPATFEKMNIRVALSEFDGKTPNAMLFPNTAKNGKKLSRYKLRLLKSKDMWSDGFKEKVDPFNWVNAKKIASKTLYITEGEYDAAAVQEIFTITDRGGAYSDREYAIISIPNGSGSAHKDLAPYATEINKRWQEIVLIFDQDQAGEDAVREVRKIFPHAREATLPLKDANACLEDGRIKAAYAAIIFNSSAPLPDGTLNFSDIIEDAVKPVEFGLSYPWKGLTDLTYGQRKQELVSIGGGTGNGKTLTAYEIMMHNATEHKWKGLGVFLEASTREVLMNICGKVDSVPYHVPGTDFDPDDLRATATMLNDYVTLWNPEEAGDCEENWEGIKTIIRTMSMDLDYVVLDNLTALSEGLDSATRNDFIGKVAKEAVDLAMKFDIEIIFYSHLNAPERSAKSHENGGKVLESQFTGSRALQRYSHMMFGFARNKMAVDPSCSYISVLKNRKFGRTGICKTYYTETSGRLLERNWDGDQFKDRKVS